MVLGQRLYTIGSSRGQGAWHIFGWGAPESSSSVHAAVLLGGLGSGEKKVPLMPYTLLRVFVWHLLGVLRN